MLNLVVRSGKLVDGTGAKMRIAEVDIAIISGLMRDDGECSVRVWAPCSEPAASVGPRR